MMVVIDHCLDCYPYSDWNTLFGQVWVLQCIFIVCGVCFGLSQKRLSEYCLRLLTYAAVGITLNWMAFILTGRDWKSDFWNVIFQFFFVFGLIVYSVLLAPVHLALSWASQTHCQASGLRPPPRVIGALVIACGCLFIFISLSVVIPPLFSKHFQSPFLHGLSSAFGPGFEWRLQVGGKTDVLSNLFAAMELSTSNVWLALSVPIIFPEKRSATGWLILTNMMVRRLSSWYAGLGEKVFNGFDLMLLGLVCRHFGLMRRKLLGRYVCRYWFLWMGACGLMWIPGTHGRYDLLQPTDWQYTWRMRILEFVFMGVWLVGSDRFIDSGIFTEDKMDFINDYCLALYLMHRAVHIVFPSPFNWLVLAALCPFFWYWKRTERAERETNSRIPEVQALSA